MDSNEIERWLIGASYGNIFLCVDGSAHSFAASIRESVGEWNEMTRRCCGPPLRKCKPVNLCKFDDFIVAWHMNQDMRIWYQHCADKEKSSNDPRFHWFSISCRKTVAEVVCNSVPLLTHFFRCFDSVFRRVCRRWEREKSSKSADSSFKQTLFILIVRGEELVFGCIGDKISLDVIESRATLNPTQTQIITSLVACHHLALVVIVNI